jgi:putative endonuclease
MSESTSNWFVYIVRCSDGTLYTGITTDLQKRVAAHNSQKGAKYTATRTPVTLVWSQPSETRSTAAKEEYRIKQLSRTEKLALIDNLIL